MVGCAQRFSRNGASPSCRVGACAAARSGAASAPDRSPSAASRPPPSRTTTARRRRDIGVLLSFRSPPQEVNQHQRRFVGDDVSDGLSHTRRGNASRNRLLLRWGTLWGTFSTCLFVPAR